MKNFLQEKLKTTVEQGLVLRSTAPSPLRHVLLLIWHNYTTLLKNSTLFEQTTKPLHLEGK